MATLSRLKVENFRSIRGPLVLQVPTQLPLVLIGENNAGKSNIVRALNLVLGRRWSGNHDPEDHEFFGRDRARTIEIIAEFARQDPLAGGYTGARWSHNLVSPGETAHQVGPSQYPNRAYDYMSNAAKSSCTCIVIGADRNLDYELSYRSQYTFLSQLMHRFHKLLTDDEEVKQELEGLFGSVKEKFETIQPFADFKASLQEQLGGFAGSMTHRLQVDFQAYNPVNFFHALRLHATDGTSPRSLDELGTGEQQVLALSFAYAFATAFHEGIVLVIEEPEAHLHPLAQRWLSRRIQEMCRGGLQIILTTHSPHFVDVMGLEGIALVRKDADGTTVTQQRAPELVDYCTRRGVQPGIVSEENVLPFYAAAATSEILEGFFSKLVVLVEGPTEALSLPLYLERCGCVPDQEGIAVVPVLGKGNLGKWRRLFDSYGIPTYLVFDNDGRSDDGDGRKRTDALLALGIPDEQAEGILDDEDWVIDDLFMVFGQNFEASLRQHLVGYRELEEAAAAEGIDAKPLVARYVAERLQPNECDGWDHFREFARSVRALLPELHSPDGGVSPEVDEAGSRATVSRPARRRRD